MEEKEEENGRKRRRNENVSEMGGGAVGATVTPTQTTQIKFGKGNQYLNIYQS